MSLLIFAFLVLAVVALCIWGLQAISTDPVVTRIGAVVLLLVGVVVIVQRAGLL